MEINEALTYQEFCKNLESTYEVLDHIELFLKKDDESEFHSLQDELLEAYDNLETFILQAW